MTATIQIRPRPDQMLVDIADYAATTSRRATKRSTPRAMPDGHARLRLARAEISRLHEAARPVVPGADARRRRARAGNRRGSSIPCTAAFNIGTLIRWLDFNDTWLAAEWGHPSDNLGAILAVADYLSARQSDKAIVHDRATCCTAMIKAHEIQGVLALENSFNRVGLDHVLLVRIASTAVATAMLGGTREQIINAVSNAWIDGGALRTYRHAPNTGSRKSWAAGDATSRGVRLALMAIKARWVIRPRSRAKGGAFATCSFAASPSSSPGRSAPT